MHKKINVLVADDNIELVNYIKNNIDERENIKIVGIAYDGINAVKMIKDKKPDILLLDIVMPNLDGIGVLESISEMPEEIRPASIVLTAIGQDRLIHKSMMLGAEYYIVKPFDVDVLISRIKEVHSFKNNDKADIINAGEIYKNVKSNNIKIHITKTIRRFGIPPHVIGYKYIRESVMIGLKNKGKLHIYKTIYPAVARKFDVTPAKVERSIRNAVQCAWSRLELEDINKLFGFSKKQKGQKPTNSMFIAVLIDRVRLEISSD